jgi:hypothetical protein
VDQSGPYYPLGTIGTVPRAHDMFRAYEELGGIKMKMTNEKYENVI